MTDTILSRVTRQTIERCVCVCVIGHSLRAKEHEVYDQLHHHPAASVMEKVILCRLSVHEENVAGVPQEHEEVI